MRPVRQSRLHLFNIGFGGQVFVGALRAWLAGDESWRVATRRLREACGAQRGREAEVCLARLLETLTRAARRPLFLNHPRHFSLSHDEWLLTQMIAAAQDEDRSASAAMLSLLLCGYEAEANLEFVVTLAEHLRRGGLRLSRHAPARPPRRADGGPEGLVACG